MEDPRDGLRERVRAYNATCELIDAGRAILGPTAGETPMIEAARLEVLAALDACEQAGYTTAELDVILSQENARSAAVG